MESDKLTNEDIFVFAFLNALITSDYHSVKKAISAGQPIYMFHVFPKKWANPDQWRSLGRVEIKSKMVTSLKLELGGQSKNNKFQTECLVLSPHAQVVTNQEFFTLSYFSSPNLPDDSMVVYSSTLDEIYIIDSYYWRNIWVYGLEIILGGYITFGEFRKKAIKLPVGSQVFQCSNIPNENFTLPIQDLHPLNELFERAKEWSPDKKSS